MQWLAAEIADNCEDEGLRAAALHTAELADGAAHRHGAAAALSLSSLPSLVSRVSELAADNWRRPGETATPRRLSGGGPTRSPALTAPSPMAPADESPGAYVPPSRRGAAAAGERRARSLAEKRAVAPSPRRPQGLVMCGVKAQFYLYAPLASAAAASRSNALSSSRSHRAIRHHRAVASRGRCRRHRCALEGSNPPFTARVAAAWAASRGGGRGAASAGHGRSSPPAF